MENSFFGLLMLRFIAQCKASALWHMLNSCVEGVSNIWKRSGIYKILFESDFALNIQGSMVYRIFSLPFTLLNYIGEKCEFKQVKESSVLKVIAQYLEYGIQLNTRFFGSFLLVFGVFYIAKGQVFNMYGIAAIVVGFIGIMMNLSGTRALAHSVLIQWGLKFLDLEWVVPEDEVESKYSSVYGSVVGAITGMLLWATTPLNVLLILIGLTGLFLMFYKPVWGLFLTVFIAPILPTMIMVALCGVVAVSVVVRNVLSKEYKWKLDDIGFLLMALLAMYSIGVFVSFTRMSSFTVWLVYLVFIGFYIVMNHLLTTKSMVFNLIKVFVISGTVVAVYGILQYVFGWGINENWIDPNVFATLTKRAYSTLENPNILGEYLILTIMAGTGLMVTRKTFMARLGYAGCTGIMILCLLATFSRGNWLGIGLAVAIFITFYNARLWILSIPAILIAPLVLPENVIIRFMSIGNMEDTSTAIRVKIWLSSLGMGSDFMLTGLGLGAATYAFAYPFYAYYYIPAHHSHNVFFQVLIEAGIVGLLLFIALILRFVKHMTLTYHNEIKADKSVAYMVLAIAAGVGGFFVQGMFDYSFYNYRMVLIFWLFVCLGTALARVSREEV